MAARRTFSTSRPEPLVFGTDQLDVIAAGFPGRLPTWRGRASASPAKPMVEMGVLSSWVMLLMRSPLEPVEPARPCARPVRRIDGEEERGRPRAGGWPSAPAYMSPAKHQASSGKEIHGVQLHILRAVCAFACRNPVTVGLQGFQPVHVIVPARKWGGHTCRAKPTGT